MVAARSDPADDGLKGESYLMAARIDRSAMGTGAGARLVTAAGQATWPARQFRAQRTARCVIREALDAGVPVLATCAERGGRAPSRFRQFPSRLVPTMKQPCAGTARAGRGAFVAAPTISAPHLEAVQPTPEAGLPGTHRRAVLVAGAL